jgi:hypothetical protein
MLLTLGFTGNAGKRTCGWQIRFAGPIHLEKKKGLDFLFQLFQTHIKEINSGKMGRDLIKN